MIDRLLKFSEYLDKNGQYEQSDKILKTSKKCLLKFALDTNDLRNVYLMEVIPNEIIVQDEELFRNMFVEVKRIWEDYVYRGLNAILGEMSHIYHQSIRNDKFEEIVEKLSRDEKYSEIDSGYDRQVAINRDANKILEEEKANQLRMIDKILMNAGLSEGSGFSFALQPSNLIYFANKLPMLSSLFITGFESGYMFGGKNWANIADALNKIYISGKSVFQLGPVFNQRSIADLKTLMYLMDRFNNLAHNTGKALNKMVADEEQINFFLNMKGISSIQSLTQYKSDWHRHNTYGEGITPEQSSKRQRLPEFRTPKWLQDALNQWMRTEKRNKQAREDALREILSNPRSSKFNSFIIAFQDNIQVKERVKSDIFEMINEAKTDQEKTMLLDKIIELNTDKNGNVEYDEDILAKYLEMYEQNYKNKHYKLHFGTQSSEESVKVLDANIRILEKMIDSNTNYLYFKDYIVDIVISFIKVSILYNDDIAKEYEKMSSVLFDKLTYIKTLIGSLGQSNVQDIFEEIEVWVEFFIPRGSEYKDYFDETRNIIRRVALS